MARDDRIFKVHYEYAGPEYCARNAIVQKNMYGKRGKGQVSKIEATNAEATAGWTDVTSEFDLPGGPV